MAKLALFGIAMVVVSPFIVLSFLEKHLSRSEHVFTVGAQFLALFPGVIGVYCRGAFYFVALESCDWETHVGFGSLLSHRGARLAKHASTGSYCVIGHADIGRGVRLASRVSIPSGKRQHLDAKGHMTDETHFDRVTIGHSCWLGEGATILADVGANSIVAAGAVVTHRVPDASLVSGNPAIVVKQLRDDVDICPAPADSEG